MNRLRFLRNEKGLTVRQLGDILNISYPTITNIENDKRGFSDEMLIAIADYFQVSTDYLLGKSDIRNVDDIDLDAIEYGLFREIKEMSPEMKEQIINYARFLKSQSKK